MCIFGEQICRTFFILHDWNPKLSAQLPIFPSTTAGNYYTNFCFYLVHYIDDIQMRSCHICTSGIGLFHLSWCPHGPSILLHMTGLPSFLRLSNHPLYVYSQSLTYNDFFTYNENLTQYFSTLQCWKSDMLSAETVLHILNFYLFPG